MRQSSRVLLACLLAPFGVPLVVFPLALLESLTGELTLAEALTQAALWSAFGLPAALMALVMFWVPMHLWLHSHAVRGVLIYLGLAVSIAGMLVYIVALGLPGALGDVSGWQWAALAASVPAVGLIAWVLATAAGRR